MRMKGPARPVPFIEDVAVPPEALPEFLQRAPEYPEAARRELDARRPRRPRPASRPPVPRPRRPRRRRQARAAGDPGLRGGPRAAAARSRASTAAAWSRTQFLRRQYGELVQVFREVKDAFDPLNVLNPGKVIGDDPHLMTRDLRRMPRSPSPTRARPTEAEPAATRSRRAPLPPAGRSAGPIAARWRRASACNGCGACRTARADAADVPDLPRSASEAASPRAKANLLRQFAAGALDPKLWGTEEFKAERRPLHPLQPLPDGVPVGRRCLEPDARGQGGLRREPRAAPGRLDALAGRALVARWPAGFPILSATP